MPDDAKQQTIIPKWLQSVRSSIRPFPQPCFWAAYSVSWREGLLPTHEVNIKQLER
jgi:hypothetical protein